jgi:hypothetical protein
MTERLPVVEAAEEQNVDTRGATLSFDLWRDRSPRMALQPWENFSTTI